MTGKRTDLAIVIPVYKKTFIRETLESLANQSDKRFNVYIGNDAGHEEIDQIVHDFISELNITYTRFPDNLGRRDLVAQWERCISLSRKESYLWLLPDDDIAEENLVRYYYEEILSEKNYDVYRFNTKYINENGDIIKHNPEHPDWERGIDFLKSRLSGNRMSSIGEYIFSRKMYDEYGFRNLPLAWGTDDLAWYEFSSESGIRTIPKILGNTCFRIRLSSENISAVNREYEQKKIRASLMYIVNLKNLGTNEIHDDATNIDHKYYTWFLGQLRLLNRIIIIHHLFRELKLMRKAFGNKWLIIILKCQFTIIYKYLYYKAYQLYKGIK